MSEATEMLAQQMRGLNPIQLERLRISADTKMRELADAEFARRREEMAERNSLTGVVQPPEPPE